MAGRLVAEVMDAAPALYADGLSRNGLDALVVVAERCELDTRSGRVPHARVMAVLGVSKSTATRAMRELVDRSLVVRVERGHRFRRDDGCRGVASAYYLPPLTPQSGLTQVTPDSPQSGLTQVTPDSLQSGVTQAQSGVISAQSGVTQDEPVSVESFRGEFRRAPVPAREARSRSPMVIPCPVCSVPAGRQCRTQHGARVSTHDARRAAVDQSAAS